MDTMHFDLFTRAFIPSLRRACGLLGALALPACATDELPAENLGSTATAVQLASVDSGAGDRVEVIQEDGAIDPFVVGSWVGRAEDLFGDTLGDGRRPTYVFPSGSRDITLRIDLHEGSFPTGEIRFGAGPAPAPQSGVPYGSFNYFFVSAFGNSEPAVPPIEGFAYPLSEAIWRWAGNGGHYPSGGALALSYPRLAAFGDWCLLQPSSPKPNGGFSCLGTEGLGGGDPEQGEPCTATLVGGSIQDVDCNYYALCEQMPVCACTAGGCAPAESSHTIDLWLIREGDELLGTLVGAAFDYGAPGRFMPVGTIRFQREL